MTKQPAPIFGTTIFDANQAMKGYALNKMCFSFNNADNRDAFLQDNDAYFTRFKLTDAQKEAVRSGQVLRMIEEGGNIYYLAKLAGLWGIGVQDVGAQQTGVTLEEFNAQLAAHGADLDQMKYKGEHSHG